MTDRLSGVGSPDREARARTFNQFAHCYEPSWATWRHERDGTTTLLGAIVNRSPEDRAAIANLLLDDGADPALGDSDGFTPLHSLLGSANLDPSVDIPLMRRLIDGGADLNRVARQVGSPLRALLTNMDLLDPETRAIFEAFLDYPGIEVLAKAKNGNTHLETARRMEFQWRTDLLEDYLRREGIDVPPPIETTS